MAYRVSIWTTSFFAYDQRLQKIKSALERLGFTVVVWDRKTTGYPGGKILTKRQEGPGFYLEYNRSVYNSLTEDSADIIYAADIDVMPGILWRKKRGLRGRPLILDLHEWYPEVIELKGKFLKKKIWEWVEALSVRQADLVLTVNASLAGIFGDLYQVPVSVIRNVPYRLNTFRIDPEVSFHKKILYYQGALNSGRGLEEMLDTMKILKEWQLWLVGGGDAEEKLKRKVVEGKLSERVFFMGKIAPEELQKWMSQATFGLNLLSDSSKSYYYSLANKFFDYMQVGLPSVNMKFPEYQSVFSDYPVGLLAETLAPEKIADSIQYGIADKERYMGMIKSANQASQIYIWEEEEKFFSELLQTHPVFRRFFTEELE